MDGGFLNFDVIPALENIRFNNRIIRTYDFVERNAFVYDYHTHGTDVMCVLAGELQRQIAGSAPEANYLLIRTENTFSEFPGEQDFWAAGADIEF